MNTIQADLSEMGVVTSTHSNETQLKTRHGNDEKFGLVQEGSDEKRHNVRLLSQDNTNSESEDNEIETRSLKTRYVGNKINLLA